MASVDVDSVRFDYYRNFSPLLLPVARSMGMVISRETVETQVLGWEIAALVDDEVDRAPAKTNKPMLDYFQRRFVDGAPAEPKGMSEALATRAERLRERLDERQASTFAQLGIRSIGYAGLMRTVTDPVEYANLTLEEGRLAGEMFNNLLSDGERAQAAYDRYADFVRTMTGAANLVDSIFDLPKDYREGLTKIRPTPANVMHMAGVALPETVKSLRMAGVWQTGGMVLSTTRALVRTVNKKLTR